MKCAIASRTSEKKQKQKKRKAKKYRTLNIWLFDCKRFCCCCVSILDSSHPMIQFNKTIHILLQWMQISSQYRLPIDFTFFSINHLFACSTYFGRIFFFSVLLYLTRSVTIGKSQLRKNTQIQQTTNKKLQNIEKRK